MPLGPAERASIVVAKCGRTVASRSPALLTLLEDFQAGPWYDANVWLAHLDDAVLCPPGPSSAGGDMPARDERTARILQRYALAAPYYSLGGDRLMNCSSEWSWFREHDDSDNGGGWSLRWGGGAISGCLPRVRLVRNLMRPGPLLPWRLGRGRAPPCPGSTCNITTCTPSRSSSTGRSGGQGGGTWRTTGWARR